MRHYARRIDLREERRKRIRLFVMFTLWMVLGVSLTRIFWTREIHHTHIKTLTTAEMAEFFGLPVDRGGFTIFKDAGSSTFEHTLICPNCGRPIGTISISYSPPPGPGWRAYDLDPERLEEQPDYNDVNLTVVGNENDH